jgi:3-deoxy-D-manno-octulosonic-acid transferase
MARIERIYTAGVYALEALLPLAARGEGKLARGVRGRRESLPRMEAWAKRERDPSRPLVWFHAPSVGEGLQATAVLEALRARRPDLQIVYTHFSPSAESLAGRVPADFAGYLPIDTPRDVGRALDAVSPTLIVFSKTDVWPNLTREAKRRGVRLAMISGTLPSSSSRLRGPARSLLGPSYGRLDRVGAISAEDAERFAGLGVPEARRSVMGDAHFDRVLARVAALDRDSVLLGRLRREGPLLVAGSTWGEDEARLLPAVAAVREAGIPLELILVPHEPTESHLEQTESRLDRAGLARVRLGEITGDAAPGDVVVVDRVGVLGEIYALADVAYVGGGFGRAGLHSVLEPAAFGIPVIFGPRHRNAREAGGLLEAGGAMQVEDAETLVDRLLAILRDPAVAARAGTAARAYVEAGRGAADRGADLIEELLGGGGAVGR